ncbi:hypothetical protein E8E14_000734 [Neopestalotiopsis sp. 37M]|nr:hypothetical protein E8E14_000734 [Neopestalotiopsis sp. 37M]
MLNDNSPSWLFTDPYAYQYSDLSNYAANAQGNRSVPTADANIPVTTPPTRRPSYHEQRISGKAVYPVRDAAQAPEVCIAPVPHAQWSSLEPTMPNGRYHHHVRSSSSALSEKIPYISETTARYSTLEVAASPAVVPNKPKSAASFDDILRGVEYEKSKLGFKTWEIERARGRRARARFDSGH